MQRALVLAREGEGFTSPNPCVGALIVDDGKIVAEGWHVRAGGDHAEIVAMNGVGSSEGLDLYVTLEPCAHEGKTPSCATAIVSAGFRSVKVGMLDPFPKVNGKGVEILREAGVTVEILESEEDLTRDIALLNQPFLKKIKTGLPYVTLKAGISLDGKITTSKGDSQWITSGEARDFGRLERSRCDAVLVGAGTVEADDCELAPHGVWANKKLIRIVLGREANLSLDAKVFRDSNVIYACADFGSEENQKKYFDAGIELFPFSDVKGLLLALVERDVASVFVEGGSAVNGLFYDAFLSDLNIIDRALFFIAPKIIGGSEALSVIGGNGVSELSQAKNFLNWSSSKIGEDLLFTGLFNLYR